MWHIKADHNVSQILAQLVAEEGGISTGPESDSNTDSVLKESMEVSLPNARASVSSVEAPSGVHLPLSFGDIEEHASSGSSSLHEIIMELYVLVHRLCRDLS